MDLLAYYQSNNQIAGTIGNKSADGKLSLEDWKSSAANLFEVAESSTSSIGKSPIFYLEMTLMLCILLLMVTCVS